MHLDDFIGLRDAVLAASKRDPELMFDVQVCEPESIESLRPEEPSALLSFVKSVQNSALATSHADGYTR